MTSAETGISKGRNQLWVTLRLSVEADLVDTRWDLLSYCYILTDETEHGATSMGGTFGSWLVGTKHDKLAMHSGQEEWHEFVK